MQSVVGGVFSSRPDACYDGLHLTTSNVFMAFGDFPPKDDWIKFSRKEEYAKYLEAYADHFGLRPKIRFETRVVDAKHDGSNWVVTTVKDGAATTERFDCMMVTTGANAKPKMGPISAALEGFEGEVIHSDDFQNPEVFKGKRVLIVGQGESAADIATDIAKHAAKATVWGRKYLVVAPRYPDMALLDRNHDEETVINDASTDVPVSDFLESFNTNRFSVAPNIMGYGALRQFMWRVWRGGKGPAEGNRIIAELAKQSLAGTNGHGRQAFWQADLSQWVTKNSRAVRAIAQGHLAHIVAPKIEKIDGRTITFAGGETATVDVVLCCTGYSGSFDWIANDIGHDCTKNCVRGFYKHAFPPGWGHCLAFAGYCRGHQGGIPQMGEMVARCAARVFSGRLELPEDYAKRAEVEADQENRFFVLSPHLKPLVDYPSYMDAMARWLGCEPWVPWFRPKLLFKYLFYPLWPCWYRLDGVGANRAAAMAVLDKFPISKAFKLTPYHFFATPQYVTSKLLAIVTYPFTPKVGLDRVGLWMWVRPKHYVLHGNSMRFFDLFRP